MEIKFTFKNRVFCLVIGKITPWFEQIYFITLIEEEYVNLELVYADLIFKFL